ncbi:hypothetical protein [Sphingomonas sp. S2-65]|uniref:hypothetical protein n=1 Tax=Sphingomonas sp. S2-65 TaxID=2903960 RepID=UPI001F22BCBD|nr:hypothetical protein [Sphingomonas sp. S2-65]UYY57182.1 hypothetical protein LZ586_10835 [Sphingomonas sp. S2-65]
MPADRIVSIALLTQREADRLAGTLQHCYPVSDGHSFEHLLAQLDQIEIEPSRDSVVIRVPAGPPSEDERG